MTRAASRRSAGNTCSRCAGLHVESVCWEERGVSGRRPAPLRSAGPHPPPRLPTTPPPAPARSRCPVSALSSREQQVDVAEFVPEVLAGGGGFVCDVEELAAGDRLEHLQVRCLGFVPAGQETVDRGCAALGCDDHIGPAL